MLYHFGSPTFSPSRWAIGPRILARKLFTVNGERVKHVVRDGAHQERTHPVFYTLQEEWEKCIQTIQDLQPGQALVKIQGGGVRLIRTIEVQDRGCSEEELEAIKRHLAQRDGIRCEPSRQNPHRRHGEATITEEPTFWEPTGLQR